MPDPLQRVSDLFVEGKAVVLGVDADDKPVIVWVNKLNSFEREESIRDGTVRRSERMAELAGNSPEIQALHVEMSMWPDDELRKVVTDTYNDEIWMEAMNNLQTQSDFRELEDFVRRAPSLQADDAIPEDDPRRTTLVEKSEEYTTRVTAEIERLSEEKLADMGSVERAKLERLYVERWRADRTLVEFMGARRITEMFLAVRECEATESTTDLVTGKTKWDHSKCDHTKRLFSDRSNIRRLADETNRQLGEAINELSMSPRDAGNSDAPASSSASSGQSSDPEAESVLSSQEETPLAVHTT